MPSLLPQGTLPRIVRRRDPKVLPQLDHLVAILPADAPKSAWSGVPGGAALGAAARRRGVGKADTLLTLHLETPCPVTVGFADREGSPFRWLALGRKLAAEALAGRPGRLGIMTCGAPEADARQWLDATVSAVLAAIAPMPKFKSGDAARESRLTTITLLDGAVVPDANRLLAAAEGNHLARWLAALPPNRLDARGYRGVLEELAAREGWSMEFLDEAALEERGAGAFLAVARANPHRDAGIAHIRYRPQHSGTTKAKLAFVGKGICFDTGGTNLKPFRSMLDMHEDMLGSAVALGTLVALARVGHPEPVDCWLAITENHIGSNAYKSRDIVTAANGTTIEVIHTDAEGRMVLADTLALAGREQPELIVDFATLTGACVAALTDRYSGVFSNRDELAQLAVAAGRTSGERVWAFPMDADFDEALESSNADVQQCAVDNDGDHILAARFLQRFVPPDIAWLHVDLAAGHRKGGLAHVATPQTGFGVRLTLAMLLDHGLASRAREGQRP